MAIKSAKTPAEAEAQVFSLPAQLKDWRKCAVLIDGYAIAQELGFELMPWGAKKAKAWQSSASWDLNNLLELRLMLFWTFRADYWSGYTYHEHDDMADSLLRAISARTGLPYPEEAEDSRSSEA